MKIAIRYQSRGGNTRAVAEAIAKAAGVTAQPISIPLEEPVDLLFVGGGVYAWTIDATLKAFLEGLSPDTVKSIAAFSTAGGMNGTPKIAATAKEKGLVVRDEALPIRFGLRNYGSRGGKDIELTDKQLSLVNDFVKALIR